MTRHWEGARTARQLWSDESRGLWVWTLGSEPNMQTCSTSPHPLLPHRCDKNWQKNGKQQTVYTDVPCDRCIDERMMMATTTKRTREATVIVRMRTEELDAARADAERADVTVSEWVRRCLREGRMRMHELAGGAMGDHSGTFSGLSKAKNSNGSQNGEKKHGTQKARKSESKAAAGVKGRR